MVSGWFGCLGVVLCWFGVFWGDTVLVWVVGGLGW